MIDCEYSRPISEHRHHSMADRRVKAGQECVPDCAGGPCEAEVVYIVREHLLGLTQSIPKAPRSQKRKDPVALQTSRVVWMTRGAVQLGQNPPNLRIVHECFGW